ncbi:MAG TPA: cystathionine beta-lyase [Devosia sp.]|nr:cystathionine beta-lyase [Devosia sp.]
MNDRQPPSPHDTAADAGKKYAADSLSAQTRLVHTGRHPRQQHGMVNTPVYRASTVLYPNLAAYLTHDQEFEYGRRGTPSSRSVEDVITSLENGAGTRLTPSGLSAISCALMSVVGAGDELLVSDSIYEPTRIFCDGYLARMGVTTRYYDPAIGAGIAELITPATRAVMMESPGSLTFEIQDLPAIVGAAKGRNVSIIIDNTWATPLFYRPLELGADIVVHAGTKMFVGHSDAMFGTITANRSHWDRVETTHGDMGLCAGADDCFLAARGLRTLAIRMKEFNARALDMARWLEGQAPVRRVLHPGLASHPGHAIFKRDFSGGGCTFSFALPKAPEEAMHALFDGMELFGIGVSWGGFEGLIILPQFTNNRTVTSLPEDEQLVRLHIGLEEPDDLKADLKKGLERYRAFLD